MFYNFFAERPGIFSNSLDKRGFQCIFPEVAVNNDLKPENFMDCLFKINDLLKFLPCCSCRVRAKDLTALWKTEDPDERVKLQDIMQEIIDKTPKKEFEAFDLDPKAKTSNPVLQFYDQCLERLLKDIPATQVKPGTAAIWYLYDMGYIIKTPEVCFGVDIHHRQAEKLEPLLDFLAVTHNHADHYSLPLLKKMTVQNKLVISNFHPNPGYTKAPSFTRKVKGITIHCGEADHNSKLIKFTMPMEFVCPTGDKKFVFFTSGDCFSHDFLEKKSACIDLYAIHPCCGMDPVKAAEKLRPAMTFVSHLQELSHEFNVWRWSFPVGRQTVQAIEAAGHKAYAPVWGEKFIWDGEQRIIKQER